MRSHVRSLFIVALAGLLALAAGAAAQDTIVLITPTAAPPATTAPNTNTSPSSPINPSAADLPQIGPSFSINPAGLDGYIVTDSSGPMFMREGDSIAFRPVAVVTGGVSMLATGTNEDQTWWRVRTANNAFEGWINAELLALRGDLTDVPVIPDSQKGQRRIATFATFVPQRLFQTATDLNTAVLCTFPAGEYVVLSLDETTEYYQIRVVCSDGQSRTGYIDAENGAFRNATGEAVPVVAAPPLQQVAPAVVPATATPVPAASSSTTVENIRATVAAADTVDTTASSGVGPSFLLFQSQVVYDEARIRPSAVVCNVPAGLYPVIARSNTDFYLITATCDDGRTVDAWISVELGAFQNDTTLVVPLGVTPTPDTGPNLALDPDAPRFVTFVTQPVSAAPDDDASTVCNIVASEHEVTGRTSDGSFFRLSTVCSDGSPVVAWISGEAGAFRNPAQVDVPVIE